MKNDVQKGSKIIPKPRNGVQDDPMRRKSDPKGVHILENGRPVDRVVPEKTSKATPVVRQNAGQRRNNLPVREVNRTINIQNTNLLCTF